MRYTVSVLQSGDILDGYRLIRLIGEGGFGEVWLCRLEATGEYKALKFLPQTRQRELERERQAVIRYRSAIAKIHSPHLVPIEHINRNEAGLYYTMPLADGLTGTAPESEAWQPMTLATLIARQRDSAGWLSSDAIRSIMRQVLEGVQALHDAGIIHRDIKPENILFINGCACLGDVSLLAEDATLVSARGTPGYAAPSWYLETGGNPDHWGAATTLFTLLTGSSPDKIGKVRYLWPPQGKESLSGDEAEEWRRLHSIIWRATHETPLERYRTFSDMRESLNAFPIPLEKLEEPKRWAVLWTACVMTMLLFGVSFYAWRWDNHNEPSEGSISNATQVKLPKKEANPELSENEERSNGTVYIRSREDLLQEANAKQNAALRNSDHDQYGSDQASPWAPNAVIESAAAAKALFERVDVPFAEKPTDKTKYFGQFDALPAELESAAVEYIGILKKWDIKFLEQQVQNMGAKVRVEVDWVGVLKIDRDLKDTEMTIAIVRHGIANLGMHIDNSGVETLKKIHTIRLAPRWEKDAIEYKNGILTIGVPFVGSDFDFTSEFFRVCPKSRRSP